jgi:hypothetical protein
VELMTITENFQRSRCDKCGKIELGCSYDDDGTSVYFICRDCEPGAAEQAARREIEEWMKEKPDRTDEIAAILTLTLNV